MPNINQPFPILLAADDPNDALLYQRAARKAAIINPVHVVANGEEVLRYLTRQGEYADKHRFAFPRFLITDLKMPRMDGLEVLKWLHDHPGYDVIPTAVWSASSSLKDIEEAYKWGANSYLIKPATFDQLEQMMRRFHDYWSMCSLPDLTEKQLSGSCPRE